LEPVSPPRSDPLQVQTAEFQGADDLAAALQGVDVELTQCAPKEKAWSVRRSTLPNISLQQGQTGASSVAFAGTDPGQLQFLLLQSMNAPVRYNGEAIGRGHIGVQGPGSDIFISCQAPYGYDLLSLNLRKAMETLQAFFPDDDPHIHRNAQLLTLPEPQEKRWRETVHTLEILAEPETRLPAIGIEDFENALLEPLFAALRPDVPQPAVMRRSQETILRRIREYIHVAPEDILSLAALCRISGTGLRNLQYAFRRSLGITPAQFLRYRRFQIARRLLRTAAVPSVKSAALHTGFWDLGRFAVNYQKVFGESPSITLRHPERTREA